MNISAQKIELAMAQREIGTAKQLAEKSGISRQNISTIKTRGTCRPSTAMKLAKALGVDITELLAAEERS